MRHRRASALGLALLVAFTRPAWAQPPDAQEPPQKDAGVAPLDARELDAARLDGDRRLLIDQALESGAYERAQTLLLEEIERSPGSAALLRLLGGVFFVSGQYLDSAIALKKAEALAPLDDRSRFTLAMSYVVMDRPKWARPELEALAGSDGKSPLYPYWIARLDYDEQRYADAVVGFRRALALDPAHVKAHDNLGLAYEALGRYEEAIGSYQEAIRLNRERRARSPWPALNLGILLTKLERLDEAEPLLREAAREDPRFAPARYQLGLLLEKKGRSAEAIAELSQATNLDPAYAEPQYALARLYRRAGNPESADHALERFLALKKEKSQASGPR
jgi:tetratricopeptide (TPR) repeat protein